MEYKIAVYPIIYPHRRKFLAGFEMRVPKTKLLPTWFAHTSYTYYVSRDGITDDPEEAVMFNDFQEAEFYAKDAMEDYKLAREFGY